MGILDGKNGLIFGVANDRSIAAGIARSCHAQGAKMAFTHLPGEKNARRVNQAVGDFDPTFISPCDVTDESQITAILKQAKEEMGHIDFLVHSLAFANKDDLTHQYHMTSKEGFSMALEISAYSLSAITRELMAVQPEGKCSIVTMSYLGAVMAVQNYNIMGVAKAALESAVRYLAIDLGPQKVRVNTISAGAIRTLASMGISDFPTMMEITERRSCLKRTVTQDEVGECAAFLASDMASGITAQTIYVDGGYNVAGL